MPESSNHAIEPVKNIANFAVELVVSLGSEVAFSLTGGMAMHINRAVAAHPKLRVVYCQHEQAVVAAAEGYSHAANMRKAGFAVVTSGPGVTNTVSSLVSAFGDSTPLIVLAGQIKTADIDVHGTRTNGVQEVRSEAIISPCVKKFTRLSVEDAKAQLIATLAEAFSGRPGPVFIEIPLDVQGHLLDYQEDDVKQAADEVRGLLQKNALVESQSRLTNALTTLLQAQRPLVYVGNGTRAAAAQDAALAFARQHDIPLVFSWCTEDMMPADDPLFMGCPGGLAEISANDVLSTADVTLFLGARLDLGTTAFQRHTFGAQAKRIIVDIDTAELAKFGPLPNCDFVHADLRDLASAIKGVSEESSTAEPDWLASCQRRRKAYLAEEQERMRSSQMNVYNITTVFNGWAENRVWIPASSGYAEETFSRFFAPKTGSRFFNGHTLGSMGFGLPQSLGAAFGTSLPVCCLEADGGLMLNLQELATLVHYSPKGFVLFVLNNAGYESIRASQTRFFGGVSGVDTESGVYIPEYEKIAAAFGLEYHSVSSIDELKALLPQLNTEAPPVMVDLHIERFEYRGPAVKTIMDKNGRPSSTPLSEITW